MRLENNGGVLAATSRLTRGFLVLFFFVSYLILYLFSAAFGLRKIPELSNLSREFVPAYRNFIPGLSYVGFIVPLVIAIIASLVVFQDSRPNWHALALAVSKNRFWLIAVVLSVAIWRSIPGFASGGHTDFLLAILICIYVGWHLDEGRPKQFVLSSIALGFGIGFLSDLQSQTFFTGIFGGWGLLDGDLIGTAVLPLAILTTLGILRIPKHDRPKKMQVANHEILYRKQARRSSIHFTRSRAIQTDRVVIIQPIFEESPSSSQKFLSGI